MVSGASNQSEWLPIESAPATHADDDPIRILVWIANGAGKTTGCVAFGHVFIGKQTGTRRPYGDGFGGNGEWKITHWMPLPPAPPDVGDEPDGFFGSV